MIITRLSGGLGNQLFQWAASYSAAKENNCQCYFDFRYFSKTKSKAASLWNFELDKFNLEINPHNHVIELPTLVDCFVYQPIKPNHYLIGYWQSEKYFINHRTDIINLLENISIKKYLKKAYKFLSDECISLHVRRGDYLNIDRHNVLDVSYYYNALEYLDSKNFKIVVVSDDINWCKENFQGLENLIYVEETNLNTLYIMALCKHNIIANSSFSWWGAWLNTHTDKKVIAPSVWFGGKKAYNCHDIVPEQWIKL